MVDSGGTLKKPLMVIDSESFILWYMCFFCGEAL